jgi:hypothetical protein
MRSKLVALIVALFSLVNSPALAQQPAVKTFVTDDKSFTFNYPADWYVEVINPDYGPNAHLSVDNLPRESRLDAEEGINLQISLPVRSFELGYSAAQTPKDAVAQNVPGISRSAPVDFGTPSADKTPQPLNLTPATSDVKEFKVNGRSAAYAYDVHQVNDRDYSRLFLIADLGNDYWITITASSFYGGLKTIKRYEPIVLAIIQSMRYTPPPPVYSGNPALPQVYSGAVGVWKRGFIKFYYPKDWYAYYVIATVVISNKPGKVINTLPQRGQFIAAVNGVSETRSAVDPAELFNECNTNKSDLTARKLVEKLLTNITPDQLDQMKQAGITMTKPEVVTVNSKEIVYLRQYQNDMEVLSMFIDLGNGYIPTLIITAYRGELAQFEKQLFAVAATFQYTPKPCTQPSLPVSPTPRRRA